MLERSLLDCGTVDASCKFPFTHSGATYSSCTTASSTSPWCSSATDSSGQHVNGSEVECADCTERDSYEAALSSKTLAALYRSDIMIDGADTKHFYFFTTPHTKPWLEIQLSSAVAGIAGLEFQCQATATKYLGNIRVSAGLQPTRLTDGVDGTTVDHVNTYLGKYKGPTGGGEIVYITFPQPVLAKYILLQKDNPATTNTRLAGQEIKVLVGTLYCPDDWDRGVEAGATQDFRLNFFKNKFTYSCGAGRKFSGLSVQTLTNSCQLRSGCDGVCWEYTTSNKIPPCIREYQAVCHDINTNLVPE